MCQRWSCTSHKPGRRTVMATCRTRNFGDWDVLPHYETGGTVGVDWISYTETDQPSASGWTLTNFCLLNGRSEVFGASELGPGERPTVTVELPLGAAASGLNKLTMGTGGGAVAEIPFDGTKTCGYYISPC